jgi:acyl-CoA dehydrogenase
MVLKNWHETKPVEGEKDLVTYSLAFLLHRAETAMDEFLQNLPSRPLAGALRAIVMPLGRRWDRPHDDMSRAIAGAMSTNTPVRNKLLEPAWTTQAEGQVENPVAVYNALLVDYDRADKLYRKVAKAYAKGELPMQALHPEERVEAALKADILSQEDAEFMRKYEIDVLEMLTVDDFEFDAFAQQKEKVIKHNAA